MRKLDNRVSIYSLLSTLCVVVMILTLAMFYSQGITSYVDEWSVIINEIIGIIALLMIKDARNNNNSLLFILSLWIVIFVMFRVVTLNYTDFSDVLGRFSANCNQVNFSLLFTVVCTLSLWRGLHMSNIRRTKSENNSKGRGFYKALWFFIASMLFFVIKQLNIPLFSAIAVIFADYFFHILYTTLLFAIYVICSWNSLNSKQKKLAISCLLFYALLQTLGGSRSGLYSILLMALFISLSLGYNTIPRKAIIIILVLIPVMFAFYIFSSYMRALDMTKSTLSEKKEVVSFALNDMERFQLKDILASPFDRIGYIDYTCEMVSMREPFRSFFNLETEMKSIVDNAISPGFDVFDIPKISNMIALSYNSPLSIVMSKKQQIAMEYNKSDELTIFGESAVLFGIPLCFIFLLILGLFYKRLWITACQYSNEQQCFIKSIILHMFQFNLSSYGIDWLILDVLSCIITYKLFVLFVYKNKYIKIEY